MYPVFCEDVRKEGLDNWLVKSFGMVGFFRFASDS